MDKCALSAQYTIDPPTWAKTHGSARRAVGTAYHAGLEYLYGYRKAGQEWNMSTMLTVGHTSFDIECSIDSYTGRPVDVFTWDELVPDREAAFELIDKMLTQYVLGGNIWPDDWEVVAVEDRFTRKVAKGGLREITLSGAADLVLRDPNGWIVGVDNKTAGKAWNRGKEHPRKNNQSALYVSLLRSAFPGAPGYRMVFDIMQYPTKTSGPKFERRISDPTRDHEMAIVKKAQDFAFLYDTIHVKAGMDLPANPASTLCNPKWCDFFDGCPYGATLDT